jgi:hypothetical protein
VHLFFKSVVVVWIGISGIRKVRRRGMVFLDGGTGGSSDVAADASSERLFGNGEMCLCDDGVMVWKESSRQSKMRSY